MCGLSIHHLNVIPVGTNKKTLDPNKQVADDIHDPIGTVSECHRPRPTTTGTSDNILAERRANACAACPVRIRENLGQRTGAKRRE